MMMAKKASIRNNLLWRVSLKVDDGRAVFGIGALEGTPSFCPTFRRHVLVGRLLFPVVNRLRRGFRNRKMLREGRDPVERSK